jgi:hypothetical protein
MRRPASVVLPGLLLLWPVLAMAQPARIPRMAQSPQAPAHVYEVLRNYLADTVRSSFELVSADPATRTIVAKRHGIDTQTWGEWAYCKVGPEHLLDTLEDGTVTVTVKIEPSTKQASFISVSADFEATYALGSKESVIQCISNGIVENELLKIAGGAPPAMQ